MIHLYETLREPNNQWDHSINAGLYGANAGRIDLSHFTELAATIYGVYKALAGTSTLIKAPSLEREANCSPLISYLICQEQQQEQSGRHL